MTCEIIHESMKTHATCYDLSLWLSDTLCVCGGADVAGGGMRRGEKGGKVTCSAESICV